MSRIAESIAVVWKNTPALCALVPYDRIFTGRVPETEVYNFPYITIRVTSGREALRTDETMQFWHLVGIDVWVDGDKLSDAETISNAITDAYANQCWKIDSVSKVIDVIDDGPGVPQQLDKPNVKAWWIAHDMNMRIERQRAETEE